MKKINIFFDNGYALKINLNQNNFVKRWCQLLQEELNSVEILQLDSFSGLLSESLARKHLIDSIEQVNNFLKIEFIKIPVDTDFDDVNFYNQLHEQFEKLAGPSWDQPTKLMLVAPDKIKLAVRHINRFCHRLEQRPYKPESYLKVEFNTTRRELLKDDDYDLFEYDYQKNYVYLDYSTLGKSLYECYHDKLTPEYVGMKIQRHYSANFMIMFDSINISDDFFQWLDTYNIPRATKGIGQIPLGYFEDDQALLFISQSSKITNITLE